MPAQRTELTRWQQHKKQYGNGCGSSACSRALKVVLAKGQVPCDVLLLGEAPGPSENIIGLPFIGPAGKLLDQMIQRALQNSPIRIAFTNIVACIPLDDDGEKFTEPPDSQVKCCSSRLQQFIQLADPKLIICVGKLAWEWLDPDYRQHIKLHKPVFELGNKRQPPANCIRCAQITHPAAILRANLAQRSLMIQRNVVAIRNAVEQIG